MIQAPELIGNSTPRQNFKKILKNFSTDGNERPFFVILAGPGSIGLASQTTKLLTTQLGNFAAIDFLAQRDIAPDGKTQSIPVESDDETALGIREINTRLQHSPAGPRKILLLENAERLTASAANAFLKAAEEPLPHRLIVLTTANLGKILPTIRSRALLLRFERLSPDELRSFATTAQIPDFEPMIPRSMGQSGLLRKFASQEFSLPTRQKIRDARKSGAPLLEIVRELPAIPLAEREILLDALLFRAAQNAERELFSRLRSSKKSDQAGLNADLRFLAPFVAPREIL